MCVLIKPTTAGPTSLVTNKSVFRSVDFFHHGLHNNVRYWPNAALELLEFHPGDSYEMLGITAQPIYSLFVHAKGLSVEVSSFSFEGAAFNVFNQYPAATES